MQEYRNKYSTNIIIEAMSWFKKTDNNWRTVNGCLFIEEAHTEFSVQLLKKDISFPFLIFYFRQ